LRIESGLFSAIVTAFIIEGYKKLTPDPGDKTIALLTQISLQLVAISNGSQATILTLATDQAPAPVAVCVSIFWILSLIFSLACTLAATLVQQWARNFMQQVKHRPAPDRRARIRMYLSIGIRVFKMSAVEEAIPTLLHISVVLFFVGLIDFLLPINHIVGYTMLSIFIAACRYFCRIFRRCRLTRSTTNDG